MKDKSREYLERKELSATTPCFNSKNDIYFIHDLLADFAQQQTQQLQRKVKELEERSNRWENLYLKVKKGFLSRSKQLQAEKEKNKRLVEGVDDFQEFLGHIEPKVGEAAFAHIWSITEELKKNNDETKR